MIKVKKIIKKGEIDNDKKQENPRNDFFEGFKLRLRNRYEKIAKAGEPNQGMYIIQRIITLEPFGKVKGYTKIANEIAEKIDYQRQP